MKPKRYIYPLLRLPKVKKFNNDCGVGNGGGGYSYAFSDSQG